MANVSSFSGAMPVIPGGLVELGYSQITSNVTVDNATAGTGTEVIAPLTVVCDGGPISVEFFCGSARPNATSGDVLSISLFEDGSEKIRYWGYFTSQAATDAWHPVNLRSRLTPSAGSHTYSVRAYVTNTARTGTIAAGSTTAGNPPASLRVSKIVNQNDGLKPFWTPPVVTQLPSQATVGDQVIYAADATNGVYWHLQYDGLGTYPWKFIGGAPYRFRDGNTRTNATSTFSTTGMSAVTLALPGDYDFTFGAALISNTSAFVNQSELTTFLNTSTQLDTVYSIATAQYGGETVQGTFRRTGFSANDTVILKYRSQTAVNASSFNSCFMNITPVQVKAA